MKQGASAAYPHGCASLPHRKTGRVRCKSDAPFFTYAQAHLKAARENLLREYSLTETHARKKSRELERGDKSGKQPSSSNLSASIFLPFSFSPRVPPSRLRPGRAPPLANFP